MQILLFTVFYTIRDLLREKQPNVSFKKRYLLNNTYINSGLIAFQTNYFKYFKKIKKKLFNKIKIQILHFFTKTTNQCKLYTTSTFNIFLSPGIILRFLKLHRRRALRKHKRT